MPDPQQTVKITTCQEEVELPYHVTPVDITAYDQFEPGFLKSSTNNKVPAIMNPKGPDGARSPFSSQGLS
jgi:GST-like protein